MKGFLSIAAAILGSFVLFGAGCNSRSTIALANGYCLKQAGEGIRLVAPNGKNLLEESISQFCVSGDVLYGWIDGREAYFLLNTLSGEFREFVDVHELNRVLAQTGIPRLDMKNSFTFWDIQTGRKVPGQ